MTKQNKIISVIFGTLMLDMVGIGMIIPILPVLFTDPLSPSFLLQGYSVGVQYFLAGLITALPALIQFIAAPLLGELSDIYGRKKLLILGVAVLAISQLMFGFGIAAASLVVLFIARSISGLASANFSIAQATIADITEPKDRAKNFGLISAAFGIGFIIGPLLGGWIAHATGSAASPFWFAGILGIVNVAFISLMLHETRVRSEIVKKFTIFKGFQNIVTAFRDVDARPVYLANMLYMCGFAFFTSFVGILLVNQFSFTEVSVGTFFGAVGFWIIFTQLFVVRIITKNYSERRILSYAIPMVAVTLAAYPFMPSTAFIYLLIPFMAIPQGLTMANMTALISKSVSSEKQGAALGINGSIMALSQGIIPIIAGIGTGIFGLTVPFICGGLLALSAWYVLFVAYKRA
jgi:DHA1 family tetracycline resistance protein-like MFS transporter